MGGRVVVADADEDVGERVFGVWIAGGQRPGQECHQRRERAIVGGLGRHPSQRMTVGEVVDEHGSGQLGTGLVQLLIGAVPR